MKTPYAMFASVALDSQQDVAENRDLGFHPAYLDFDTQRKYLSRFADGSLASVHVLDGLPDELVIDRLPSGRAIAVKASVIPGFVRGGYFYTRAAAARAAADWQQGR